MLPPGPAISPIRQTAWWGLRPAEFLEGCRAQHGETFTTRFVKLGRSVFFSDPAAVRQLFAGPPETHLAGKTKFVKPILGEHSVLCLDGDAHLRQRRLLLGPFHGAPLRAMAAVATGATEERIARWPAGTPFAALPRMTEITMDVILTSVFGFDVADAGRHRLRSLLFDLLGTAGPLRLAQLTFRRDLGARPSARTRLGRLLDRVDGAVYEHIASARTSEAPTDSTVLAMLLQAVDEDGRPMSDKEIRDELLTMLLAGHETTATSLAWALERLARHPQAWARLRDEARTGGSDYAQAVAHETLRCRPVLWLAGRTLTRPTELGGWTLPAGTLAYACNYLLHTREDLYPEPYAFRPERFLGERPATYAWIPFGGGRRRCIGASFAQGEMVSVLQAIARRFDTLRPGTDGDERMRRRGIVIAPSAGARITLA